MRLRPDGQPVCKRCGYELDDANADTCPKCQFSPREKGLRVALSFLLVMIISMTILMVLPTIGSVLLPVALVSFALAFVTFIISFLATPSRLGSLFLWP